MKVLRQFGKRDLLWDFLTAWQDPDLRVPIPADEAAIREMVLYGTTGRDDQSNIIRFGELLYDAWLSGVKLRFTFLTLGLGSSRLVSEEDRPAAASEVIGLDDPTLLETFGDGHYPSWITQRLVMRQYWSAEYAEGLTPADGAGTGGLSGSADPVRMSVLESQRRWIRISLDLQDSRKLQAIYWIAHACAELLVLAAQHALAAHGGVRQNLLAQVLDGIELFNEVDGRNVMADAAYAVGSVSDGHWDPQASGAAWGRAWTMAALG
ncbi:hypothetical protein L6R53_33470, partial [Myxococcota bacterium]|nr:hypothetical protein [Myxococcota bacterium]